MNVRIQNNIIRTLIVAPSFSGKTHLVMKNLELVFKI